MVFKINKYSINSGFDIFLVIVNIILIIGLIFFSTFGEMLYWNWFITLATGWSKINYWLMLGISFTISLIRGTLSSNNSSNEEGCSAGELLTKIFGYYLGIGLMIGLGALIHLGV